MRSLQHAEAAEKPTRRAGKAVEVSWFSGEPLERGISYDPISLTFQPKVARITASDHLSVNYDWKGNVLQSVHTRHEEKKTAGNVARLALGVGMAAGAGMGTVNWKTAERETNDFYFNYYDDAAQVFNVNRDNQVVKSRTINIMIPGIGGFGAFGALGSLGSMASLGSMRGLAGSCRYGGTSSWSGLIATASSLKCPGGLAGLTGTGIGSDLSPALTNGPPSYSIHGDPQGGASSGYVSLCGTIRASDTGLALHRRPASASRSSSRATTSSIPFGWDGLHLFELDYDAEGRVMHAWELDQPTPPRLDFQWDGRRLMSVTAHENTPAANVIYTRTLSYLRDPAIEEDDYGRGQQDVAYPLQVRQASADGSGMLGGCVDGRAITEGGIPSGLHGEREGLDADQTKIGDCAHGGIGGVGAVRRALVFQGSGRASRPPWKRIGSCGAI